MTLERNLGAGHPVYFVEGEGICADGEPIVKKGVLVHDYNPAEDAHFTYVPEKDFSTTVNRHCVGLQIRSEDILTPGQVILALTRRYGQELSIEDIDKMIEDEDQNRQLAGILGDTALAQEVDLDIERFLKSSSSSLS